MYNNDLHKLGKLYSSLSTEYPREELAMLLGIPEPEKRQRDLQYITSIFVSSGFNLNAAYFLPSELVLAQDSIVDKALDIEHAEDKIVGHLYSKVFAYKDGTVFDPNELQDTVGYNIEKVSMDIITAARIYKARFPEVAADVESGKYSVSMECFYRDYDIIVDDIIIPKAEAMALGLTKVVNNVVQVVEGAAERGKHRVGRVLRGILFSGMGLVEQPANPGSVILETASQVENGYILDLTKVDSYMSAKQEKESIVIHSFEGNEKDLAYISASYGGSHRHMEASSEIVDEGTHTHIVMPGSVPEGMNVYFVEDGAHTHGINLDNGTVGYESPHTHKVYVSDGKKFITVESSEASSSHNHEVSLVDENIICGPSYGGSHYHEVDIDGGVLLKTVMPSDILNTGAGEMVKEKEEKEAAGTGNADGRPLSDPDICISFKRYVYERGPGDNDPGVPETVDATPGLVPRVDSYPAPSAGVAAGDNVSVEDKIVHENWCALFDTACPTPGGLATHPECLRLVLNRTTKETISNYYEQLQENRRKAGVNVALSSLLETVEEAKKFTEVTDV